MVGTRGAADYTIGDPMENTEIYNDETDGVLRLKLEDNAHEWRFVPVAGESVTDSGAPGATERPVTTALAAVGCLPSFPADHFRSGRARGVR